MSRRETGFSWEVLDALLQRSSSKIDCAAIMDCSSDTIERNIKEKHDMTFVQYREKKMATTRTRLIEKALSMAFSGDRVMLIFSLKNLCNWKDKQEISTDDETRKALTLAYKV